MLFTSIWSILVLVYGKFGPRFLSLTFSSIAAIVMEGTCVIFWCSGFFALLFPAIRAKYGYLCGSDSVCGSFVADEILALFNWGFFTFIGVMDLLAVRSSGQLSSMQHPSMQHPGSAV
ncbi:hypothetical protein QBC43DRAFT_321751 [Cladorrhinum sp. PSN259]|nr:hypothetical protein QBC43DRAFT_321751 [Cladorrhinum sp. PSN259]